MRNFDTVKVSCLGCRGVLAHLVLSCYKTSLCSTAYAFIRFPETFIGQKSTGKKNHKHFPSSSTVTLYK